VQSGLVGLAICETRNYFTESPERRCLAKNWKNVRAFRFVPCVSIEASVGQGIISHRGAEHTEALKVLDLEPKRF
jgi:hypothetical protein